SRSADLHDGGHRRCAVARRQPRARRVHEQRRLRLRVSRGGRKPRQHGADGHACDIRVLRRRVRAMTAIRIKRVPAFSMTASRMRRATAMTTVMSVAISIAISVVMAVEPLAATRAQPPIELRLWPDGAPGSEEWSLPERVSSGRGGDRVVTNVSDPTLTVFLPDPAIATGTAIVIAPGGALRALAIDNEGVEVAEWLNGKGIAGFVLKYRTLQQDPDAPRRPVPGMPAPGAGPREELVIRNANANPAPDDDALNEVLELAIADAREALRLVRANAAEWGIDPSRV